MELKQLLQCCNWNIFKSMAYFACDAKLPVLQQIDFFEHIILAFCNFENAKACCDVPDATSSNAYLPPPQ
jgi:hypothetical protein